MNLDWWTPQVDFWIVVIVSSVVLLCIAVDVFGIWPVLIVTDLLVAAWAITARR